MQRRRQVAAAPERTTAETVSVIGELVRDTLTRSVSLDPATVDDALSTAKPALLALVAGGHLDRDPLVLIAAQMHLSITTVTGDDALSLEENLEAVTGAASATEWTLYLPTPAPLTEMVTGVAKRHPNLSAEEPPDDAEVPADRTAATVDLAALARREAR
jgi:hypothetical protein